MTGFGMALAMDDIVNALQRVDANTNLGGAPSAGGKFQVDLVALQKYYGEVYGVWSRLGEAVDELRKTPYSNVCTDFGEITGVAQSMEATVNGAVGPDQSLFTAMQSTQNALAKHLDDIKFVYQQYIEADNEHASQLSGTMGGASHVGYGTPGPNTYGSANAAEHNIDLNQYH